MEDFFEAYEKPRCLTAIAVAFYIKDDINRGYPNIEANKGYFKIKSDSRKFVLLHEIIHACQRVNDLEKTNQKYFVDGLNELNFIETSYINDNGTSDPWIPTLKARLQHIDMFTTWIFEIWAEMFFKKKYPEFFKNRMEFTYGNISSQYKRHAYSGDDWAKFPVFAQMVRAYYMMKISQDLDISLKYKELFDKWNLELSECTKNGEYDDLMNRLESLTNITSYDKSDTFILEKPYDEFIKIMKESILVFSL